MRSEYKVRQVGKRHLMAEVNRTVLARCLLLVGEVASENAATFEVSGLEKFISEGGAITKYAANQLYRHWNNPNPLLLWKP